MTEKIKQLLPHIQNHYIFSKHDFRLVGGTALSYHVEHRISEDLDFCLQGDLPLADIQGFIEDCIKMFGIKNIDYIEASNAVVEDFLLGGSNVEYYLQTWVVNGVKIQFYDGSGHLGAADIFQEDECTAIGDIKVSSMDTIFKMKSLMFYKRTKSRDLFDMLTMYSSKDGGYTPEHTKSLIMKYDKLYYNDEAFNSLWLETFENKEYNKDMDEGLMGLTVGYVIRRLCLFALVVWVGASLNFFVPRLAPGDPAAAMISRMEAAGGRGGEAGRNGRGGLGSSDSAQSGRTAAAAAAPAASAAPAPATAAPALAPQSQPT